MSPVAKMPTRVDEVVAVSSHPGEMKVGKTFQPEPIFVPWRARPATRDRCWCRARDHRTAVGKVLEKLGVSEQSIEDRQSRWQAGNSGTTSMRISPAARNRCTGRRRPSPGCGSAI